MRATNLRAAPLGAALVVTIAALAACGGDSTAPTPAASVVVSPDSTAVIAGQSRQLTATVLSAQGDTLKDRTVTWKSADALIASVSTSGLVSGVGLGLVAISATVEGKADTAKVLVTEGPDPSIASVSPSTGTVGTEIKITGQNFRSNASVFFGSLESDSVDVTSGTEIFAFVPNGVTAGTAYAVRVLNRDLTAATLDPAFTAIAPDLDFVNGATKPSGKIGTTVIVEGNAFGDLRGVGQVLFSDASGIPTIEAPIASEDDWTNTFIVTTVPTGAETGPMVVVTATGTSNALTFTVTQDATFSPSVVDWQQATDLPVGVSGHAAVFVPIDDVGGQTIFRAHVIGGASNDSLPRTAVDFAQINGDGTLSAWTSTSGLSDPRAFHAAVAATPFNSKVQGSGWLYALGGISAKNGEPLATILRAPLSGDGTVGAWSETRALPLPLHSLGAVIFRSTIYVAGGATTGNVPTKGVYRAAIDTLGNVGMWEALPSLPIQVGYSSFTRVGNCLHTFGGDSAAVNPNSNAVTSTRVAKMQRSKINLRTGALTTEGWVIDNTDMTKARAKHTALIAGGGVLVTAGLYDGIGTLGSNEQEFAQIGGTTVDACEVDSFAGATNEANIAKKGGGNLFNHAAIVYVDANGASRVMILGGDDVDNPGVKRKAVWFF
jgi:hypothetical protein